MTIAPDLVSRDAVRDRADVVIVGGGIAGGALATVLARSGMDVLVLERDRVHRDRNKGECMMAWGYAELDRLGLVPVLDAAGGHPNPSWRTEGRSGGDVIPVAMLRPDAPGTYTVLHPDARAALVGAAAAAGARVRFGANGVRVTGGKRPSVTWHDEDGEKTVRCRLVVGADGRTSVVRRQLAFRLRRTERTHVVSACLVSGTSDLGDSVHVVAADERLCVIVPIDDRHARLYLVTRDGAYGGMGGAEQLRRDTLFPGVDAARRWASGKAVGPASTYGGEDTWVDQPASDGVLLIGDAAGYNSPIIGQGLALAITDVGGVADALIREPAWTPAAMEPWIAARAARLERVRFMAQLWARFTLRPDSVVASYLEDPLIPQLYAGFIAGFDHADPALFSSATAEHLLGGPELVRDVAQHVEFTWADGDGRGRRSPAPAIRS